MQIDHAEIHLISDGVARVDGGGAFGLVPRVVWERLLPPDEFNRIPLDLSCLLIRSENKTILVDTGLGDHLTRKQQQFFNPLRATGGLIQALARLGTAPEAVDIVINTHLHIDHCGGNTTRQSVNGKVTPTFPNAEYLIQRLEWADAAFPNERTRSAYVPQNFLPLQETEQLRLLDGDTRITGEVRTVITRGHTRAHQSVVIETEEETVFYTGDLATLGVHFERLGWVTAYDVEPLETIETKRRWQRWALERDAVLIFAHDPQTPIARLQEDSEDRLRLRPISFAPTQQLTA